MADTSKSQEQEGFKPGTLEEFKERFGDLDDRFEHAVHPYLEREEMPTAEHPDQIEEREEAEALAAQEPEREFLPDHTVSPDFESAVDNVSYDRVQGEQRGSSMVEGNAPEHNMRPPPEMAEDQDRLSHYQQMNDDDYQARVSMSDEYYADLEARLSDHADEQELTEQLQSHDQGQEFGR